ITIPWFIGFFILATIITTILPDFKNFYAGIKTIAIHGLTLTLFLIGSALSRKDLKEIGLKPMIQAVLLWIGISMVSLLVILSLIS
ncbi:MAG: putative sulfate exporter family transporter, partial [Ignavibacteriales bacterium]|nr:putative sulfate exporter family transporter [Ignavibacteriales bacterium]